MSCLICNELLYDTNTCRLIPVYLTLTIISPPKVVTQLPKPNKDLSRDPKVDRAQGRRCSPQPWQTRQGGTRGARRRGRRGTSPDGGGLVTRSAPSPRSSSSASPPPSRSPPATGSPSRTPTRCSTPSRAHHPAPLCLLQLHRQQPPRCVPSPMSVQVGDTVESMAARHATTVTDISNVNCHFFFLSCLIPASSISRVSPLHHQAA